MAETPTGPLREDLEHGADDHGATLMLVSVAMLLGAVALGAAGHLLLREGMVQVGRVGAKELQQPLDLLATMLTNRLVLIALPLYGTGFLVWAIVLSRLRLSLAYPAMASMYVVIPLAAWGISHESVTIAHWIGMVVIVAGVLMVLRAGLT